jgi:protein-S-isoprenylcysteine O-methyltransferase Ste14
MSDKEDVPGVIVFPPLIPLTVLVVGALLDWLLPLGVLNSIPVVARAVVGIALFGLGLALLVSGERAFERIGTNVNPFQPSISLASSGVYGRLRNPMYVGGSTGLVGVILCFGLEWTFLLFVASCFVLHYGVVLREERYLERKFGEDYRRYKASVPRYGWTF